MKSQALGAVSLFALMLLWTAQAELAEVQPLGKVSVEGGAEKEAGSGGGGRATITTLGVMPLGHNFGLQGTAHYVGGLGSRYGLSAGPLFSWESGKAGLFVAYQHRSINSDNFVHLRPSVAFYLPQANINLYYSQPISNPQRDTRSTQYATNYLQGTFSYFIGSDLASFLKKDNVEMTLGVQVNSFAGAGSHDLQTGVGPVFGLAFMPMQGIEVNVVKGTVDNRGRYRVQSGLSYYFDKAGASLMELRRRYLEPNFGGPNTAGSVHRKGTTGRIRQSAAPRGQAKK